MHYLRQKMIPVWEKKETRGSSLRKLGMSCLLAFAIPVRLVCKCENCLQSEWIAVCDAGKGEKWSAVKGLRFNENGEAIVSFSGGEAFDLCSFACLPVDSGDSAHGNEVQVKLGEMYFGFSTYDAAESFARRLR